ncbi:MAG: transposase [Candidatus Omnitrophica bacterium]|nr:transposase [Candidatus Omnitrophota bacterium]
MPRLARTFMKQSCYHVIIRGNQRQRVFKRGKDYVRYLRILKKAKKKYGILLYAYCLMPNHVHLLIEAATSMNMSKFMQWVNRGYSAYFNNTYKTVGHLWQGRFISKPIMKDQYMIHCANYIESNPLRTEIPMVDNIADYKWSSYRERCISSRKDMLDDIRDTL